MCVCVLVFVGVAIVVFDVVCMCACVHVRACILLADPAIYTTHNNHNNRGWTVAFSATMVVMGATALRIPLSTVNCQVGAVAAVGVTAYGMRSGGWHLFARSLLAWVVTFPSCALLGAGICWVLSWTIV